MKSIFIKKRPNTGPGGIPCAGEGVDDFKRFELEIQEAVSDAKGRGEEIYGLVPILKRGTTVGVTLVTDRKSISET
tara:strand:- start:330 stop:557 length:228 start_codon:yes stop_codon:yes gene_type:complete